MIVQLQQKDHKGYFLFLLMIYFAESNSLIYREMKRWDYNTTIEYGYFFLDPCSIKKSNVEQIIKLNIKWFRKVLIKIPEEEIHQQKTKCEGTTLKRILEIVPNNLSVSIITGWYWNLPRFLESLNSSQISTVFIDSRNISLQTTISHIVDLEKLGIDVGICLSLLDFSSSSTITINDFEKLKTVALLLTHDILYGYYDYDTVSRNFDATKENVIKTLSTFQPHITILFGFQVGQKFISSISASECIRYQQLALRFVYNWGKMTKQFVIFLYSNSVPNLKEELELWPHDHVTKNLSANIINAIHKTNNELSKRKVMMYRNDLSEVIFEFSTNLDNLAKIKTSITSSLFNLTIGFQRTILKPWITLLVSSVSTKIIYSHQRFLNFVCDITHFVSATSFERPQFVKAFILNLCSAFVGRNSSNRITFGDSSWTTDMNFALSNCVSRLKSANISFGCNVCTANKFDIFKNITDILLVEARSTSAEFPSKFLKKTNKFFRTSRKDFSSKEVYLGAFSIETADVECGHAKTVFYGSQGLASVIGSVSVFIVESRYTESLAYILSMINDACIAIDNDLPKYYNRFLSSAGVTLPLNIEPFNALSTEEIVEFITLIKQKFGVVEIIPMQDENEIHKVLKALLVIFKNSSIVKTQYYVNMGNLRSVQNVTIQSELFASTPYPIQMHFEIDENDIRNESISKFKKILTSSKTPHLKFGISSQFPKDRITNKFFMETLMTYNYVILDVDVNKKMQAYLRNDTKNPEPTEYRAKQALRKLFQDVIDIIEMYKQTNSNLDIMLRIKYNLFDKENIRKYLLFWRYVDELAVTYDFKFLIHDAFAGEAFSSFSSSPLRWWTLRNQSMWRDPRYYVDLQADYYNLLPSIPESNEEGDLQNLKYNAWSYIIPIIVASVLCIITILGLTVHLRKKSKVIKEFEMEEFKFGRPNATGDATECEYLGEAYDEEKFEIGKFDFQVRKSTLIGIGNFGLVYKSHIPKLGGVVAVKTPNPNQKNTDFSTQIRSFLREIKVMSYAGDHENILRFLGAYTSEVQEGVVLIVTEYCKHGPLLTHLRNMRQLGDDVLFELCRFSQEVASGLDWLASKNIIHGDLSARNILLHSSFTCKISDFGLSRRLEEFESMYRKKDFGNLPWAWMSSETLNKLEFTIRSDIWSLGVTFWEIFSFGLHPYEGTTFNTEFIQKLNDGEILPQPRMATQNCFGEIQRCWNLDPLLRPDASHFLSFFASQRASLYVQLS